jgi:hypothetical protein
LAFFKCANIVSYNTILYMSVSYDTHKYGYDTQYNTLKYGYDTHSYCNTSVYRIVKHKSNDMFSTVSYDMV